LNSYLPVKEDNEWLVEIEVGVWPKVKSKSPYGLGIKRSR